MIRDYPCHKKSQGIAYRGSPVREKVKFSNFRFSKIWPCDSQQKFLILYITQIMKYTWAKKSIIPPPLLAWTPLPSYGMPKFQTVRFQGLVLCRKHYLVKTYWVTMKDPKIWGTKFAKQCMNIKTSGHLWPFSRDGGCPMRWGESCIEWFNAPLWVKWAESNDAIS